MELSYPIVNGIDLAQAANQNFPTLVAYIFYLCLGIVGILGVAIIAYAGFEYLTSGGNPGRISEAKDRVRSAIIGIVLLLLSWIIIGTINPDLLNLRDQSTTSIAPNTVLLSVIPATSPASGAGGMIPKKTNIVGVSYAYADKGDYNCVELKECSYDESTGHEFSIADAQDPDLSLDYVDGIIDLDTVLYNNSPDDITVQLYYLKDFGENTSTQTVELISGASISLNGVLSYKWKVRPPGIYFYSGQNCTGDSMYDGLISSQEMPADFRDARSVKIINSPKQGLYYGFILNAADSFRGACGLPAINTQDHSICLSVKPAFFPQYVAVFNWNQKYNDQKNYQNGVSLYGMPRLASAPVTGSIPNRQDYYYIPSGKVINQYYYAPNGPNGSGYYHQAYYNISSDEIITQVDTRGYYICPNDPGFLLRDGDAGCGAFNGGGSSDDGNQCTVDDPIVTTETSCPQSDGAYCIQAVESRDRYLYGFYTQSENGSNLTCALYTDNIYDLPEVASMQNGEKPYTFIIIPVQ